MMKKWLKKTGLIAAGIVALTSIVSAVPVSADASRVVVFPIQSLTTCSATDRYTSFMFSLSNINSDSATVNVYLYAADGTPLTDVGFSSASLGYTSTLTPGMSFTLGGQKTAYYTQNFGYSYTLPCSKKPAWGKIVVESESGRFVASAEMRATAVPANAAAYIVNHTTVSINNGQPF